MAISQIISIVPPIGADTSECTICHQLNEQRQAKRYIQHVSE